MSVGGDEIRALADRLAVGELCDRYLLVLDEGRFDESWAAGVFTDDVELAFPPGTHHGLAGLDAFTATFMGPWARTHHHTGNYLIDLDGDQAAFTCPVIATHVHPGSPPPPAPANLFRLGGWFSGTAVRTPSGWRLNRLALRVTWTVGSGAPAIVATMTAAQRAG
ncbi:nuclear transport factor 2 family protein [Dactylosporangium sp. CA-139066]|uniref:nuclear transport factor 2 family protein n=1 Tax=Dactylosporangium sp. CA-139066 TaxID=3239930 RepID=UPI003D8DA917